MKLNFISIWKCKKIKIKKNPSIKTFSTDFK